MCFVLVQGSDAVSYNINLYKINILEGCMVFSVISARCYAGCWSETVSYIFLDMSHVVEHKALLA